MARRAGYGSGYDRARAAMLAENPWCAHHLRRGQRVPASRADHQPPLSRHRHVSGTGCCVLVPSCYECERRQAGELGGAVAPLGPVTPVVPVEPVGFARRDRVWDVPWLSGLRRVPPDATWPRLMTAPHPRAVGSLGLEVARWAARRRGVRWRWWQRLYATRLLEVDDAGALLWETSLLTEARQLGKTWLLHDLCSWRLEQGGRFGCPQEVLSIGKDLAVVRKMQAPARQRAKRLPELYRVREVNGQEDVEWLFDGSHWMIRSKNGAYSLTTSMVTVDEAWKVSAAVVDDAIVPTMVEQPQSQLILVSTAHRLGTALMIGRRAGALERLADPPDEGGTLLVEWSAARLAELDDRRAWRQASPHWSAKRERTIAERLESARSGESDDVDEPNPIESFRTQWLNQWPAKRMPVERGEVLIEPGTWAGCEGRLDSVDGPGWVAIEDNHGQGAAVAFVARSSEDRFEVDGLECGAWDEALRWARKFAMASPGSRLIVGASMESSVPADFPSRSTVRRAGTTETRRSLPLLRSLVAEGRLVHDHTVELDDQVAAARVRPADGGLLLVPGGRSDLLRAVVWALAAAQRPTPNPAIR